MTFNSITRHLHHSVTTRRAMPQLWFDLMMGSSIAVPFSVWTQNHYMMLIAAILQGICAIWYALGWVPAKRPARRACTTTARRKTLVRNGK